jgi:DNA-directed RNA polymerase specialized sigma24 family protein
LGELVGRYIGRIRRLAYQMVLDLSAADGLAQELFFTRRVGNPILR